MNDQVPLGPLVEQLCRDMGRASCAPRVLAALDRRWIDTLDAFAAEEGSLSDDEVPRRLREALLQRAREIEVEKFSREDQERRAREDAATDADMAEERSQNRIIDRLVELNRGLEEPRFRLFACSIGELSDLSTADNTVRVDVWIYCHWIEPSRVWLPAGDVDPATLEWRPTFEIAGALDIEPIGELADCYYVRERYRRYGIVSYFRRFVGTMRVDLDLRRFPFDAQNLRIRIGDVNYGAYDVTLVYNTEMRSALWHHVDSVRHLHEFSVMGVSLAERLVWSDADSRDISYVDINVQLCRETSFYVWNVFLIIFLLSILSLWLYLIEPDVLNDRLQICITVFLALVAVNFVVAEALPKISHTTYLSFFFVLNYGSICVAAIESGVVYLVNRYGESNLAAKIIDWSVMGVFGVFHVGMFVIFLTLSTQWSMLRALRKNLSGDANAGSGLEPKTDLADAWDAGAAQLQRKK